MVAFLYENTNVPFQRRLQASLKTKNRAAIRVYAPSS